LSVGFVSGKAHAFTFDTDPSSVPWMSFRKHIPRKDGVADTDLGEVFKDGKVLGFNLTLPNADVITARMDALAREYSFDYDPASWTYSDDFENYASIPISVETGGYIHVAGQTDMAIINCGVGFQNVPLQLTRERTYGSPYLNDITVITRQLVLQITALWNDPDLYALIHTGSATGTEWNGTPLVGTLDIKTVAPGNMTDEGIPYSLRIQAPVANLRLAGGITEAGNDAVMANFVATALDPGSSEEYVTFTLVNKQAAYTWPT